MNYEKAFNKEVRLAEKSLDRALRLYCPDETSHYAVLSIAEQLYCSGECRNADDIIAISTLIVEWKIDFTLDRVYEIYLKKLRNKKPRKHK